MGVIYYRWLYRSIFHAVKLFLCSFGSISFCAGPTWSSRNWTFPLFTHYFRLTAFLDKFSCCSHLTNNSGCFNLHSEAFSCFTRFLLFLSVSPTEPSHLICELCEPCVLYHSKLTISALSLFTICPAHTLQCTTASVQVSPLTYGHIFLIKL